jgi:hypothetical protein
MSTAVRAMPSPVRLACRVECAVPLTRDALCTTRVSMSVMGSGHSHTGTMELAWARTRAGERERGRTGDV